MRLCAAKDSQKNTVRKFHCVFCKLPSLIEKRAAVITAATLSYGLTPLALFLFGEAKKKGILSVFYHFINIASVCKVNGNTITSGS